MRSISNLPCGQFTTNLPPTQPGRCFLLSTKPNKQAESKSHKRNLKIILIIQNGERISYTQDILSSGLGPSDSIVRLCCLDLRVPGLVFSSWWILVQILSPLWLLSRKRGKFSPWQYIPFKKCSHPASSLFIMIILIIRPDQRIKFHCRKFILQS